MPHRPLKAAGPLVLTLAVACGTPPEDLEAVLEPTEGPYEARGDLLFAAGSTFTVGLADACGWTLSLLFPSVCATEQLVEIMNVESDKPEVVALLDIQDDVQRPFGAPRGPAARFEAVGEGESTVTITGRFDDGTERTATERFSVRTGKVLIDDHGRCGWSESEPALLASGELHAVEIHAVHHDGERLNGVLGFPFHVEPEDALTVEADPQDPYRHILSPRTWGLVELTPIEPAIGPVHVVNFFPDGAADRLHFDLAHPASPNTWSEVEVDGQRIFRTTPVFGDRRACFGAAWVSIEVDTPEVCEVESWAGSKDGRRVRGLTVGDCVLQVTQAGITQELVVPVVEDLSAPPDDNGEEGGAAD